MLPFQDRPIHAIKEAFSPLIGSRIVRYQTAEILHEDGTWDSWPDLPIRIFTDSPAMVSVSWSKFTDLWLANDGSLPFAAEDNSFRWVDNGIQQINGCLNQVIEHVSLGRGEMSIEGRDIEIWTRLVVQLSIGWLEIHNAFDENGYHFHHTPPAGEFLHCI